MRYGVTGTREGMTTAQIAVGSLLLAYADEIHHGDCVGADRQAHEIAKLHGIHLVKHPPLNPTYRAWCEGGDLREEKDYLPRNEDIVAGTDELFAFPKEFEEQQRGGTWFTIRHARACGKPVTIIYPDGSVGS